MKKALVLTVALIFVLTATALAGLNVDAKVAVHVRPHNAKAGCTVTITYCGDIVTAEAGFSIGDITGISFSGSLLLMFNTMKADFEYEIPSSLHHLLHDDDPRTLLVNKRAPDANGYDA